MNEQKHGGHEHAGHQNASHGHEGHEHAGHDHSCHAHAGHRQRVAEKTHPSTPGAKSLQAGAEYTCPMHPEIRQIGPGSCPICGMALEPVLATADARDSPELRDMTRRLWIGALLTLPVFALEMGGHLFDLHHLVAPQRSNWIQLVLGSAVVLWAGWPFFVRGWASLRQRSLNMFTLIALGTGAAWL
ncbi:MAG TPA: heavy metal-binding domain-containing protein, partial [Thermoanaerobaculia bacterium]|nr:heavy metal-binding domain-containing protein [Thermoanaerobaculia bacterium]